MNESGDTTSVGLCTRVDEVEPRSPVVHGSWGVSLVPDVVRRDVSMV